ncbi:phosphoribosylformylglycinamidine cyclo-ligase [Cellulomonas soli]|uniref:Phosphoribosylformylglycinamidine cyclo-ligase n=1 Tax=Cellulomonas soli TaxID=931535 RepID=A0A512PC34_9CELL|nr:phosphoribosylformylglycinamidine cyclo-ligase [Cellulomonas soli]NYI58305.1 phosphoribosylformylglycinamidine cyclo-ligase [Cellulomonas soli]GEP68726.1 phosphoribosylformylglycinamidine cyclo-ligase [Cellulomonas soli]
MSASTPQGVTYAAAGVDTEAGDKAVELMKDAVRATHGPQVLGGVGGFAGLYDASALTRYRRPLLATSTDGVGTKVAIAQALDVHDTIGFDLVGMVVDDIVVVGAKPLFMTDYIACGKVVPERIADVVRGIAAACSVAGTALVGGETAEHPGLLGPDEYDVAGAATGVVEADELLGPERVRAGDVLVALASSGLHSNGYSLVRRVVQVAGWSLDRHVDELGRTLGEELLEPTRVYASDCLALVARAGVAGVHAFSHVTGGGLAANVARVLPRGLVADVDRSGWRLPAVFSLVQGLGQVPWTDLEGTLNLGVGMVAIVAPEAVDGVLAHAAELGLPAWELGRVREIGAATDVPGAPGFVAGTKGVDGGAVQLTGTYRV